MDYLQLESGHKVPVEDVRSVWLDMGEGRYELWCEVAVVEAPWSKTVVRRFEADQPYAAAVALRELNRLVRSVREHAKVWTVTDEGHLTEADTHGG